MPLAYIIFSPPTEHDHLLRLYFHHAYLSLVFYFLFAALDISRLHLFSLKAGVLWGIFIFYDFLFFSVYVCRTWQLRGCDHPFVCFFWLISLVLVRIKIDFCTKQCKYPKTYSPRKGNNIPNDLRSESCKEKERFVNIPTWPPTYPLFSHPHQIFLSCSSNSSCALTFSLKTIDFLDAEMRENKNLLCKLCSTHSWSELLMYF